LTEISYRTYNNETDRKRQRHLFDLSFPETHNTPVASESHYSWKFETFPSAEATPPSFQYIAEDEELVGYYAALPFQYKIGNEIKLCGMVCDVMTHPDRRGRGIFTKIGFFATSDLRTQGVHFTTGYPIRPEVIPGHLKVGWKVTLKLPMYLRLLKVGSVLPKRLKFLAPILNPILSVLQLWTLLPSKNFSYEILTREVFLQLDEYDSFLKEWLGEQRNALVKSRKFIEWRTMAPGSEYFFVVLKFKGKVSGLGLARGTILKGIESLAVLDMMVLKEAQKGSRVIHQGFRKLALKLKKDVVVCMAGSYWARKYKFITSLYLPTPAVFSLIVKKLDESMTDENLFSEDNWHLFWIDTDDL
jgi:hypothetical protein